MRKLTLSDGFVFFENEQGEFWDSLDFDGDCLGNIEQIYQKAIDGYIEIDTLENYWISENLGAYK